MTDSLTSGSWKIASVMGIPIRVHFSWLIVFGLISWGLSVAYFPQIAPDLPALSYWIKGVLAALLLFVSVALHELSHSFVARLYGMTISSITLFIFGGVAQMKSEPPHPRAEFWIAVAGPACSFLLAGLFYGLSQRAEGGSFALLNYLARINFLIGVFNLIPGFPMDGGRVLRSLLWSRTKNLLRATRRAAAVGQLFALLFLFYGFFSLFTGLPGGLWLMLIGWFLFSAAQASYQSTSLQHALSDVKVRNIMTQDLVTLPASTNLAEAVDRYFLRYGYGGFPVFDGPRFLGFVTLKEVKNVPRERWDAVRVGDVAVPHDSRWEVSGDDGVMTALEMMLGADRGRIAVMEQGQMKGLITRNGIARYVQIRGIILPEGEH